MSEVLFYHLEGQPLERVLPLLLEKTVERGWRAVVEAPEQQKAEALDALLWTYRDDSFLPHGLAGDPTEADQPVLLAWDGRNPNGASVRFFVEGAVPQSGDGYQRIVFLFSGHDPDRVTEARAAWKVLREGNDVTYWQQDANGRWVKKA